MKLNGHNPVDLIINHRKLIEKVFTILVVFSLICIPMVGINYDLTKYLPDSSPSAQALDIMEDEFTYPGMGRVMLHDVTLYEAKNIKDRIADVEGVDMVMWADMTTNIYGSSEFIDYDDIDDYYHEDDQSAYMDVIFEDKDSSSQTHKAVRQIEQEIGRGGQHVELLAHGGGHGFGLFIFGTARQNLPVQRQERPLALADFRRQMLTTVFHIREKHVLLGNVAVVGGLQNGG